jgi:hypothetical protein
VNALLVAAFLVEITFGATTRVPVETAPRVYDVIESQDFTPAQSAALRAAEQSWMVALPGELLLRSSVGVCPAYDAHDPRAAAGTLICLAPVTTAEMGDATRGPEGLAGVTVRLHGTAGVPDGAWAILIDVELNPDAATEQGVLAHELGHAMGLDHTTQHFTLMFPYIHECLLGTQNCVRVQAITPTNPDVAAWRHVRVHT